MKDLFIPLNVFMSFYTVLNKVLNFLSTLRDIYRININ